MEDKHWNFSTCKLCSYRSKSSFVMCKHQNLHRKRSKNDVFSCYSKPPELYPCEFCGFETNLKVDFTEHFRVFHEGKQEEKELKNILKCYRSKNCDFETHSVLVLTNHTNRCNFHKQNEQHELLEKVRANVLLEHSYSRSLIEHTESGQHAEKGNFQSVVINWLKCGKCDLKCKYESDLARHFQIKHAEIQQGNCANIDLYRCDQCEFKSEQKAYLRKHVLSKHGDTKDADWVKCDKCAFDCKIKANLKQHFNERHAEHSFIKSFNCKQYKTKSHVTKHISVKQKPKIINWPKCKECGYQCKSEIYLELHYAKSHGFQCEQCENRYRSSHGLKLHMSVKHVDPKDTGWLKCEQCDYQCKYKSYLKQHYQRKHENVELVKWFECEQCEYKSKNETLVKNHILIEHVNSKDINSLQCDQCSYQCKTEIYLRQHYRRKHGKPPLIK